MKNYVKIDCANRRIIMDRTFAKNAKIVGSEEYNKLQMARRDYEGFTVITRTISRNSKKECYHGLTYAYMERYILLHDKAEERKKKKIRADFPTMTIVRKTCVGRPSRYRGLTYDAMERYILISGNDALLDEFHQVRQFAAMQGNAYCYVRSWFLARFADSREYNEYAA